MGVYSQSDGYILCKDESVWDRIKEKLASHPQEQQKKNRPVIFKNSSGFIYNPATKKVYFSVDDIKARTMPDVLNFWEDLVVFSECEALFLVHSIESHLPLTPFRKYQVEWVKEHDYKNMPSYSFESNVKLSFFWESQFKDESDYLTNSSINDKKPKKSDYPWLEDEVNQWDFYCSLYGTPKTNV